MLSKLRAFLQEMEPYTVVIKTSTEGKLHIVRDSVSGTVFAMQLCDDDHMYISMSQFRLWCRTNDVNFNLLVEALLSQGAALRPYRLDMTTTTNVRCIRLKLSTLSTLDLPVNPPNYTFLVGRAEDGSLSIHHQNPACTDALRVYIDDNNKIVVSALR